MKRQTVAQWGGVFAALVLGNVPAQAVIVSFSTEIGREEAGWTNTAYLPQFNNRANPLESVSLQFHGSLDGAVGVENLEDKFNTIAGTLQGGFSLRDASNNVVLTLGLQQTGSTVANPFDYQLDYDGTSGYTFTLTASGAGSRTFAGDLSAFIGSGNLQYFVTLDNTSYGSAGVGTPASFSQVFGSGLLEITYTATTLPEPTTFSNFVFGLTIVISLRRWRHKFRRP